MSDGASERIEALELAVTQLADAVERVVLDLLAQLPRLALQPVLEQVAHARHLIGTDDAPVGEMGDPSAYADPSAAF